MPSTSKAQARFFNAAKHNPEFAREAGVSQGVASEFATSKDRYRKLPERKEGSVAKKKGWLKKDKGEKKLKAKLNSKEKKSEDQRMAGRYGSK